MENEKDNCKCMKFIGHLEAVNWLMKPRTVKASAGPLSTEDWTKDPHIWLHYVESADGLLPDDDVLRDTSSRYWSIHDPSRYFVMEMHCEKVMFTCQYPTLRLPTRLGNHSWRIITATKLFSHIYEKQFAASLEITLKKIEYRKSQLDRLIVSDQLLRVDRLEHLRRKTFFRCLERILSYQNNLQLVSFENLLCKRQEGVRLVEHLACFNAHSLKYLFLWHFVLPNENPILVNYSYITAEEHFSKYLELRRTTWKTLLSWKTLLEISVDSKNMTTDDEKLKLEKLLHGLDVPDVRLTERCSTLIKDFHEKFDKEIEEEEKMELKDHDMFTENPYKVDKELMEENNRKLRELLAQSKRAKKAVKENSALSTEADPKRPWRINSNKERLLRVNTELKQHCDRGCQLIVPLEENTMKELVEECKNENRSAFPVAVEKLRETLESAKKSLPNFQYRKIENTTATAILRTAHDAEQELRIPADTEIKTEN